MKKQKLKPFFFSILFLLLIIVTACTSDKTYVIKAGLSQNPEEPQVRAVKLFKNIIEEKTEGIIVIDKTMAGIGRLKSSIKLEVKKGFVKKI